MFDVLIIGGGVSGVSCALVLGSAHKKSFVQDKNIGIITHQRGGNLQDALLNNVYGIPSGKLGSEVMQESLEHLTHVYPHVEKIPRSEEHTSELQSRENLVCRLLLEKKNYARTAQVVR